MTAAQDFYTIAWAHGELTVRAVGGMIAPVCFDLGDGHRISPLHVAPWADAPPAGCPPLLAGLRGEWPCLPFGPARMPPNLPPGWLGRQPDDAWDHGYCANHAWTLVDKSSARLSLAIDLPAGDPVARLERLVRPDPDSPAVDVELIIHPRRDAVIPFALHPTFVVPSDGVELLSASGASVHSYPMPAEPGVSRLQPDCTSSSLAALPLALALGGTLDVTRLPLPFKTEELLQVADCRPPFILRYPGRHAEVLLDWDSAQLPDALLWISNGGRAHSPWCGTHYALGIEPTHSCFDLTRVATPPADHPLARRRGLELRAGEPMHISYRLSARPLSGV
jgi:hypothetical protein